MSKDYSFNGVLAQAQRMSRVQPNQAIVSFIGEMIKVTGSMAVANKLNVNQAIDVIATNMGCDPSIIRSDDEVAELEAAQQKAQQQAQQMAAIEQASVAAKNLGQAKMGSDGDETALGAVVGK
jgi:hypothetical protein